MYGHSYTGILYEPARGGFAVPGGNKLWEHPLGNNLWEIAGNKHGSRGVR